MIQHDHRDFLQLEFLRAQHPPVAGDDAVVSSNQHRIHEPELGDACGNLHHLLVGVGSRIARVRNQPLDRPDLDSPRH